MAMSPARFCAPEGSGGIAGIRPVHSAALATSSTASKVSSRFMGTASFMG